MTLNSARFRSTRLSRMVAVLLVLAATPAAVVAAQTPAGTAGEAGYGAFPLVFIPNHGQLDERVGFAIQGRETSVLFTSTGLTYVLRGAEGVLPAAAGAPVPATESWAVALDFVGARADAWPASLAESETVVSYFTGRPEQWRAGLRASSRIVYRELWPGIDLVFSGTVNRLKYEFVVRPGADPADIRLAYRGADRVELRADGRLRVVTPVGAFEDDAPVAWQEVDGVDVGVPVRYALEIGAGNGSALGGAAPAVAGDRWPEHRYGFALGDYDRSRTLVVDPAVLVYSGFIGSWSNDFGRAVAVDGAGSAYVVGSSHSTGTDLPVTVGPSLSAGGYYDVFVAKVNPSGTALEYCGYIGGAGHDDGYGVAVDRFGNAYVVGTTTSDASTFPVLVGPALTRAGQDDAFVAKVNPDGTALLYCGYIGSSTNDSGADIAVDAQGRAYVIGTATSNDLPVVVGPDLSYNGGVNDAFVARVSASGSSLEYCGYLGGSGTDVGRGIAVDGSGRAYVTGLTSSTNFPSLLGPGLTYNGGDHDAFVSRVSAGGATLEYSGFVGGPLGDEGKGIAVDASDNAYVTGALGADAFVVKLSAAGSFLSYGGTIGGSGDDRGYDIAVDRAGRASITGVTTSADFPVFDAPGSYGGGQDAFVVRLNAAGTNFVNSGYLGGVDDDMGVGIAVDSWDNIYVVGSTSSTESSFPVVGGPHLTHKGASDAFVAKISDSSFVFADGFESGSTSAWSSSP